MNDLSNISYLHAAGCYRDVTIYGMRRISGRQAGNISKTMSCLDMLAHKSFSPRAGKHFRQAQDYLRLAQQEITAALLAEQKRVL